MRADPRALALYLRAGMRPRVGRTEATVDALILGQDAPRQRRAELGGLLGRAHLLLTVHYFLTIMVPCM